MGQGQSMIDKLSEPANALVYEDEAKRLESEVVHENFDETRFLLNSVESLKLQQYLVHGASYPSDRTSAEALYNKERIVSKGKFITEAQYNKIIDTFVQVNHHTQTFQQITLSHIQDFCGTVGLYGKTAVRFFGFARLTLNGIQKKIDNGTLSPEGIDAAKKDLITLIGQLKVHTTRCVNSCQSLKQEIMQFQTDTAIDVLAMQEIEKTCLDAGGALAENLKAKQKDLQEWIEMKERDEKEYEEDKTIAGTTATYAFVLPPLSTIAAAVVLGVYIARAVQARKNMDNDDEMIAKDQADIADALRIQTVVAHWKAEWESCEKLAIDALAAVSKIELGFSAMLDNLNELNDDSGLLDNVGDLPISLALTSLGDCMDRWGHVQKVAANYKENCLIKVMSLAESQNFVKAAIAAQPNVDIAASVINSVFASALAPMMAAGVLGADGRPM